MAWRTPWWWLPWKVMVWHHIWWYGSQENQLPVSQTSIWPNWRWGPTVVSALALVVHVLCVLVWIGWPLGCHRGRRKWSPVLGGLCPSVFETFVSRSWGRKACVETPIYWTEWLQPYGDIVCVHRDLVVATNQINLWENSRTCQVSCEFLYMRNRAAVGYRGGIKVSEIPAGPPATWWLGHHVKRWRPLTIRTTDDAQLLHFPKFVFGQLQFVRR